MAAAGSRTQNTWLESLFLPHNIQIHLFPAWDKMLLVISVFIGDREENEKTTTSKKANSCCNLNASLEPDTLHAI